ncbi:DNA-binding MarR family transcriptional regulator [Humitalea rosea]|uniref:DNA-binding MarR family transcriptional regulator n=1 Tax=Humitalea rosea TaxID=990373 RepID=A0A2W7IE63_9PROT|nr:DNA-binding MarR family transcriptional regulator [Humitalea rosea]
MQAPTLSSADAPALSRLLLLVSLAAKPFARVHEHRWGISLPEWRVLLSVRDQPGISGSELAQELGLDKMAISRAVRVLERGGYLSRKTAPGDIRRQALRLTVQGEELCAAMSPHDRALDMHLLRDLAPSEAEQFMQMLDRLVAAARSQRGQRSPSEP